MRKPFQMVYVNGIAYIVVNYSIVYIIIAYNREISVYNSDKGGSHLEGGGHVSFLRGWESHLYMDNFYILSFSTTPNWLFYSTLTKLFSFVNAYHLQVYS